MLTLRENRYEQTARQARTQRRPGKAAGDAALLGRADRRHHTAESAPRDRFREACGPRESIRALELTPGRGNPPSLHGNQRSIRLATAVNRAVFCSRRVSPQPSAAEPRRGQGMTAL